MMAEVQDEKRSLQTGDDAEDAVVARIRTMGRVALEEWMRRRSAQLNATAPAKARAEGKKKLCWLTTLGEVTVLEPSWRQGTRHLRPFRAAAKIVGRACSRRLQRAMTDFGADEAFAPAATKVQEHYGVKVTAERLRLVCLRHAQRLAQSVPKPCTILRAKGPEWIVTEADGTMVPIVDTHQAPVGADRRRHRTVRWQEARVVVAQALGEANAHYDATLGDVAEAGVRWSRVVGIAGWSMNTQIHVVGDGAPWLAQQAAERFAPQGHYLLDLYHVCDYLAAVWPGDKATVHAHRDALKAGQLPAVLTALRARLEPTECPDEQAPARCALRYLENRLDQLDYPAALREGLPVGSGLIESAHRHLLQARLKLAGAWWSEPNAHAMAQLRVCRANHHWDAFWRN
jgi:hypothetical protein